MSIRDVIVVLNRMEADGVVDRYAIGGAVGATFWLEPVSTLDVDVFVAFHPEPGAVLVTPKPILDYLTARGCAMQGEYVMIADWPVQFLPPTSALVEEALREAVEADVDGAPARVFRAEHLAAIALQTGRAKDKARLLQFLEEGAVDDALFHEIIRRHALVDAWATFERQFLSDTP
ncbi:MAG TPA: hypothetical protein VNI54_00615 [Thermoanaerobaculia bacterium]|nr:hypothetical protein [Thermoanaerobaculia bacterium]